MVNRRQMVTLAKARC